MLELTAGCLVMCMIAATPAPAAATTAVTLGVPPTAPAVTIPGAGYVTLFTGDRVAIDASGTVSVDPASRRPGVSYQVVRDHGHTRVIPSDALAMVWQGSLDPRLFDVTTLAESGFGSGNLGILLTGLPDAAASAKAPAAAMAAGTAATNAAAAARSAGASVTHQFSTLGVVAARRPATAARQVWSNLTTGSGANRSLRAGITKIWLDSWRQPALDVSVPQIGAPAAWDSGYTGAGVDVAVLDTGVDATHPDLAGKVVDHANFTTGEYGEDDRDLVGHGTHVAATIAGSGAASDGKYRGVAPDARLLDGKICVSGGCLESWVLAGMQWAAADKHAKVVNMSLGGGDTEGIDPLEDAVNTLTARYGTLFVIAAGNSGRDSAVGSPGSADAALTVGAVDANDQLASFSSRGPRIGDSAIKPDVTAPGVDITAARGKDATKVPGKAGDPYTTISGTSMATPHVAGASALLFQEHPQATPAEIKSLLMATAEPNHGLTAFQQGAGRINVGTAVAATLAADPPSVSLGRQMWPHDDDPVLTRTVTYRNSGSQPVTLAVAAKTTTPAPAGMFTVTPATVTVPAGGSAAVTITANTTLASADGYLFGSITATGGPAPLTTPFAVEKEPESYDVTVTHLDRSGAPTGRYASVAVSVGTTDPVAVPTKASGTTTVRLRKGRYTFLTMETDAQGNIESLLAEPGVEVDHPASVTIDGRAAKPIAPTAPDLEPGRAVLYLTVGCGSSDPTGYGYGIIDWGDGTRTAPYYTGQASDHTDPTCYSSLYAQWRWPDRDAVPQGEYDGIPDRLYNVAWGAPGRLFNGQTSHLTSRNLAEVYRTLGSSVPPAPHTDKSPVFSNSFWPIIPSVPTAGAIGVGTFEYPMRLFFNTDGGVAWNVTADELAYDTTASKWIGVGQLYGPAVRYKPGTVTAETWNAGVYGPSLTKMIYGEYQVPAFVRTGDTLTANIGMLSDGSGRWGGGGSGSTSLSRDGTVLGSTQTPGRGTFQVPADAGRYRLSVHAGKPAPADLSTSVDAEWTFRSADTGSAQTSMPLWSVRMPLDASNAAPAGRPMTLPLVAAPQPGSKAGKLRRLTVQVSFDDGTTWQPTKVTIRPDGHGQVRVTNPTGATYASLRTHVEDSAGNALDQTIIHAYRITAG